MKPHASTASHIQDFVRDYTNGVSIPEIARKYGRCECTVRTYLRREGQSIKPIGQHQRGQTQLTK